MMRCEKKIIEIAKDNNKGIRCAIKFKIYLNFRTTTRLLYNFKK